jgi:hypothetical protein
VLIVAISLVTGAPAHAAVTLHDGESSHVTATAPTAADPASPHTGCDREDGHGAGHDHGGHSGAECCMAGSCSGLALPAAERGGVPALMPALGALHRIFLTRLPSPPLLRPPR